MRSYRNDVAHGGNILSGLLLAGALLVAGCLSDFEREADRAHIIGQVGCPEWGCGTNTAQVNDIAVGELNLDEERGDGGFRILSFEHLTGLPLDLDVRNGELVGTDFLGLTYRGSALIGSRIILENLRDLSLHAIIINDFGHVDSWTTPVAKIPAYHLLSSTLDIDLEPISFDEVCGASVSLGDLVPIASHYAVLVAGERYDAVSKTVAVSGASAARWFNIACNGSALAKMKLLGYAPESTNTKTTAVTTPAQRQATLKMITADYCGTGKSFTNVGEPLRWYNRDGTAVPAPDAAPAESSEAIWTDKGALCLDTPRLADQESDLAAAIAAECGAPLPSCAGLLGNWTQHGEWRTEPPTQLW